MVTEIDVSKIHSVSVILINAALPLVQVKYSEEPSPFDNVIHFHWIDQIAPDGKYKEDGYDIPNLVYSIGEFVIGGVIFFESVENREPYMERLARIVKLFEDSFRNILVDYDGYLGHFTEFEDHILAEFPHIMID